MFGDPVWLLGHWPLIAAVVLAIIVGKPLVIAVLARSFGQPWRYAIASGLCLAQVGEFSFVLATIAQSDAAGTALISSSTFLVLVSATVVTLLLTPYLVAVAPWAGDRAERLIQRRGEAPQTTSEASTVTTEDELATTASEETNIAEVGEPGLILIVGFGPAGQCVAEDLMDARQSQMVVVDLNPDNIEAARRLGLKAHLGDATQRDILEHADILQARAVVVTTPDHATTRHLIHLVRDIAPDAFLVVRCRYHILHWELLSAGAHEVVDEEQQVGRRLAAQVRKLVAG
jgi:CPA2 family monovalent cation:H+ antiporter-2